MQVLLPLQRGGQGHDLGGDVQGDVRVDGRDGRGVGVGGGGGCCGRLLPLTLS